LQPPPSPTQQPTHEPPTPTPKGYVRLSCTCSRRSPSRRRHSHALARRRHRRLPPPSHERPVGGRRSSLLPDAPGRHERLLRPCLAQRRTNIMYEFASDDIPLSDFTSPRRIALAVALPPPRRARLTRAAPRPRFDRHARTRLHGSCHCPLP